MGNRQERNTLLAIVAGMLVFFAFQVAISTAFESAPPAEELR